MRKLLFLALLVSSPAWAANIGVSNVAELNSVLEGTVACGDTVTLAPGTYSMDYWDDVITVWDISCSAGSPITVRCENLGDCLIRKTQGAEAWVFALNNSANWVFENLEIEGTCSNHSLCEHAWHIVGNSDGTVIRNNRVRDFNAHIKINGNGDFISFPDDVLIENNDFYATERRQTGNPIAYLDAVGGKRTIVRRNHYYDCATDPDYRLEAWCAFIKGGGRDSIFEGNLVECERDVPNQDGTWGSEQRVGLSFGNGNSFGPICENDQCLPEHTDGIIRNNIIMNCSDAGIYNIDSENIQVHNNTLYETGGGIQCRQYLGTGDCVIRNNIVGSSDIWARDGADIVESNNLVNVTASQFDAWFADPANVDYTVINATAWADVGYALPGVVQADFCGDPRPVSGVWDIGAIESGSPGCVHSERAGAGQGAPPPPPVCGDGNCDPGEDPNNCPADCGPPPPVCGDGVCEPGEEDCIDCCPTCPGCDTCCPDCPPPVPCDSCCPPPCDPDLMDVMGDMQAILAMECSQWNVTANVAKRRLIWKCIQ